MRIQRRCGDRGCRVVPIRSQAHGPSAAGRSPCIGSTATLLSDGRVIVAGNTGVFSAVSVYDPSTNTWDSAGSITPRSFHSATRLTDGRVLVAGGATAILGEHSSAELYDPVANSWSLTGFMASSRRDHTSTLLQDGRVLVAGGLFTFPVDTPLAGAEVFNPLTGTWSAVGGLNHARRGHTAVLLDDGRVLITGGIGANVLNSAEIFNPATNTFSLVGSMGTPRRNHTAAKLQNGDVLVAGGSDGASFLQSAEVFDSSTNTFQAVVSPMSQGARANHTATTLNDGRVLLAGGGSSGFATTFAELYDPAIVVPACTLTFTLGYTGGILNMDLEWTSTVATTMNVWVSVESVTKHLRSVPIAATPTPASFPASFAFPALKTVGFLASMTTPGEGILCSQWQTIDTGP